MAGSLLMLALKFVFPLFLIAYYYLKSKKTESFNYWKEKGVPQFLPEELDPIRFVGDKYKKIYEHVKEIGEKHAGTYEKGTKPVYVPVDLGLIKNILIKDFESFRNRGLQKADEINDPLSNNIFALEDDKWKNLRTKLTPTFTSGKMKMMFPTFMECTYALTEVLENYAQTGEKIDIKDLLACFSTDVITSCAFGIECHSVKNPDEPFRRHGKLYFNISSFDMIKLIAMKYLPTRVKHFLGLKFTKKNVEKFFMKAVQDMVDYREQNNIYRPDFMHLLLQLKNRGKVSDDKKITDDDNKKHDFLSKKTLAAQCFVFFAAGFETSSSVMMFTLYELSKQPDLQDKLRKELRSVLKKHDGKCTYDTVMEMTYLEQVVKEGLRMYPSLSILSRVCNQNYKVPGTNVELEKDTQVQIPLYGLHTDPEYYPDPMKFDPERFTKENENKRPACTWMPFGEGPRLCIGSRFGLMQVKVGIATILKDFKVTLDEKTPDPPVLTSDLLITQVQGKIYLNVEKV